MYLCSVLGVLPEVIQIALQFKRYFLPGIYHQRFLTAKTYLAPRSPTSCYCMVLPRYLNSDRLLHFHLQAGASASQSENASHAELCNDWFTGEKGYVQNKHSNIFWKWPSPCFYL